MRSTVLIFLLILASFDSFSQAPVLAVNRIDKRTKEHIRQSSMYLFKDGGDIGKLNFSIRAVDDSYTLLLNLPVAATIKKGTEIILTMEDDKPMKLISNNDVISINDTDVNKKMIVCDLDPNTEIKNLIRQGVKSISIPTSNKGVLKVNLLAKDRTMIRSGIMLVQKR
ncbi:hypothetical protein SAMN05421813_1573 [Daejeonella rubra]|uniref:Uncharacterized protein n=1 Tax=Daejeonella rubra TaxID=990371 RepID=A0A1G9Z7C6_9SPHI|nr:hypothetical protein [Daejeonella rubra]SDN16691.1 hypothetical protein SAMN05421813_1573 [Daejeonella rubra]